MKSFTNICGKFACCYAYYRHKSKGIFQQLDSHHVSKIHVSEKIPNIFRTLLENFPALITTWLTKSLHYIWGKHSGNLIFTWKEFYLQNTTDICSYYWSDIQSHLTVVWPSQLNFTLFWKKKSNKIKLLLCQPCHNKP